MGEEKFIVGKVLKVNGVYTATITDNFGTLDEARSEFLDFLHTNAYKDDATADLVIAYVCSEKGLRYDWKCWKKTSTATSEETSEEPSGT